MIEDIPEPIEPVVAEAMPGATLGHNLVGLTSWFHYGVGITIDQVVDILGYHLQTRLTPGGLVDAWRRLTTIAQGPGPDGELVYCDADALRLAKLLGKHWDHLFTFLDKPEVPFDDNFAERMIRPAVNLGKNSQSNRSQQGAATQAILMSIYRTLRMRGHDPTKTIAAVLKTYLQTGQLPPLPDPIAANG